MRTQAPGPGDAAYVGQRYKEALVDVLHEVNVMSYPPLCQHRNITKLIGLSFDGVQPVLIVEPAHESFPDLGHFFNPHHNQTLPNIIPFELAASLIADIADGMAALHSFCVTNADLKPGNILIFSDDASPTGLIAKISDFGMAGIDMPLQGGGSVKRAGPSTQTRGGTTNWVAPECQYSSDKRQHEATRDIYTFGLLATYIALGGRHPTTYSKDLWRTKVSDTMVETAVELLKAYCSQPGSDSRLSKVEEIARATLRKEPEDRIQSLNGIRKLLFD
jgi:serine/threonine protein kinase